MTRVFIEGTSEALREQKDVVDLKEILVCTQLYDSGLGKASLDIGVDFEHASQG